MSTDSIILFSKIYFVFFMMGHLTGFISVGDNTFSYTLRVYVTTRHVYDCSKASVLYSNSTLFISSTSIALSIWH
jgi:hypothetical protein